MALSSVIFISSLYINFKTSGNKSSGSSNFNSIDVESFSLNSDVNKLEKNSELYINNIL